MKSQTDAVLDYLRKHKKGITSMEAFSLFGATRLSAIIFSLRNKGYKINCEKKQCETRFGTTCNYGVYTLVGEPDGNK